MVIITNNSSVDDAYKKDFNINYLEGLSLLEILQYCRNEVHKGSKLLSHPLTGSIKPNETPYKSIMLDDRKGALDMDSLTMIENAIEVTEKFLNNHQVKAWPERILEDFKLIDYGLITSAIQSIGSDRYLV